VLGDLAQTTDGRWMTRPPSRCPNGHPLGPNQVLVGHVACLGYGGGGHTSWHCRTCDAVAYGPPLNTHCQRGGWTCGCADLNTAQDQSTKRPTRSSHLVR